MKKLTKPSGVVTTEISATGGGDVTNILSVRTNVSVDGKQVNYETDDVLISDSVEESELLNFTIPGNTLEKGIVPFKLSGIILNNSGDTATITWRAYYGDSLLYTSVSADLPSVDRDIVFSFEGKLLSSGNDVILIGNFNSSSSEGSPSIGTGALAENPNSTTPVYGLVTTSQETTKDFYITVELSTASELFNVTSILREIAL